LVSEPTRLSQYSMSNRGREVGVAFHEDRADAARKAISQQAFWWAILLTLLGFALLLVRALIESRR
jgi:hypothetical protein